MPWTFGEFRLQTIAVSSIDVLVVVISTVSARPSRRLQEGIRYKQLIWNTRSYNEPHLLSTFKPQWMMTLLQLPV